MSGGAIASCQSCGRLVLYGQTCTCGTKVAATRHEYVSHQVGRGRALVLFCSTCSTRWPCAVERRRVRDTEVKR